MGWHRPLVASGLTLGLLLAGPAQAEMAPAQTIPVQALTAAPSVDGDLAEWGDQWLIVPIDSAIESDRKNRVGAIEVQLQVAVAAGRLFTAMRWPDASESREYKPWSWKKSRKRYKRGKERDDMFALRFDMGGDFESCMIAKANYDVDVWLWSAGRSDQVGYATDMWHRISIESIENSAEYEMDDGTVVYIKKSADDGRPGFENAKPNRKKFAGDTLPGVKLTDGVRGSVGDVVAKGVWKEGYWHLEMSRALETGYSDDVSLQGIETLRGQMAVFDQSFAEHKSVSGELVFDFSGVR